MASSVSPPLKKCYHHNCACVHCGSTFYRGLSAQGKENFCSMDCMKAHRNVDRVCKCCGVIFKLPKSRLSANNNASGNFCSRPCYEKWMCNTTKVTGRGSQWTRIRNEVLDAAPFCAICGTTKRKRLQVHHIVPYRLTHSNDKANLIPLCLRCHKTVETITHGPENANSDHQSMFTFFSNLLRERQLLTFMVLRGLKNEAI